MRRAFLLAAALALVAPAAAHAGGGPMTATYGGQPVTNPDGPYSYFAVPAGRGAVIQAFRDGTIERWRRVTDSFAIPQAAWDGTRTGLSADGKTLVVSELPTVPIRRTRLLVLDAPSLKIEQRITLQGYSSVSGVSPDGGVIYLTRYPRPIDDPNTFEIVAHARGDGSQRVIGGRMSGWPFTRVTSADGRWEFTLYAESGAPFMHRLDVVDGTAERFALPQLEGYDLSNETLRLDGGTIAIGDLATLDPETRAVTLAGREPVVASAPVATPTPAPAPPPDTGSPWPFVAAGLALLGLVALLVTRRRHSAQDVEDLHLVVHHADEHPAMRE